MASAIELLKSLFQSMGSSVHDLRCDVGAGLILRLSHMPGNEASYCTGTTLIAAFPGCSRLQFLITCSMQKMEGEGLGEKIPCMMSGRHEGRHEGGDAR